MLAKYLPTDADWQDRFIVRWALVYIAFLLVVSGLFLKVLSDSGDVEFWRSVVSWIIFASVLFGILAANRYFKADGADERGREHLRAIKPQLVNANPPKVTIDRGERLADYRGAISGLFDGERPHQTGVRDALEEFRGVWRAQTRRFDGLAVWLSYEAALILVFGAIVILPVSWWSGSETTGVPLSELASWLWVLVTAFPGSGFIVALGMSTVLVVGEVLFDHWFVLSIILFTGAFLIGWLDRETETDLSRTIYPDRRKLAMRTAMWAGLIWFAGTFFGVFHPILGGVAAGLVAVAALSVAAYHLSRRLAEIADIGPVSLPFGSKREYDPTDIVHSARDAFGDLEHDPVVAAEALERRFDATDEPWRGPGSKPEVVAYLLVRKVWALIGVLCLPLLVAYVALAFGTGAIFAVGLEVATGPNHIRLPVAVILVAVVLLVRMQYPDAVSAFIEGVKRGAASSSVRAKAFSRGVPFLAVVIGFAATWPLFGGRVALGIGILAGVLARLGTLIWQATAYRFVNMADRDRGHPRVVIEGFTVEDADGEALYIARVDGHKMAHRDRSALVEIILSVARRRLEDGEIPPTFASYYYQEVTRAGEVDIDRVGDEYRSDIKLRVTATLREHDGALEVTKMDREMTEEYAEPAYRGELRWLMDHGDVDVRRGEYVLH